MSRTVLVTGGTGQLGREVVPQLRAAGHAARVASRGTAPAGTAKGDWATIDWVTGAGLTAALAGVDTVIHTASGSPKGERETISALLDTVRLMPKPVHLVYISIVGVDRIPLSYYRAKLGTERRLAGSGIPYSILRATQFHGLIVGMLSGFTKLPVLLLPKEFRFQPIAVGPVAEALVKLAEGDPAGRVEDLGGPAVRSMPELAHAYLSSIGRARRTVQVRAPGRAAAALRSGFNLAPEHAAPGQSFEEFLAGQR